ncbi:DoxX family protein [Intrasporangium sp. DVR]|uniref:DoxX family protein n=1 Tax=Intrasporangium sp. DVR TaxID=3127867 RepID=UPI00333FB339
MDERSRTTPDTRLRKDGAALAGLFLVSGVLHFLRPQVFEPIVPKALPNRRGLVYASGAAELACAIGLLLPATRRAAGVASAAVLVAVFPANVTMTAQAARRLSRDPSDAGRRAYLAATVARLPLQWPMIRAGLRAGGVTR